MLISETSISSVILISTSVYLFNSFHLNSFATLPQLLLTLAAGVITCIPSRKIRRMWIGCVIEPHDAPFCSAPFRSATWWTSVGMTCPVPSRTTLVSQVEKT